MLFDSRWQRGCKGLQGGCKVVARRLHDLGGCFQAVSRGGCIFWRLISSGVTRRLHILAVAFKRCHGAVAHMNLLVAWRLHAVFIVFVRTRLMWSLRMGCSVLGRGAEPPHIWVLLIWLEPGISHVTWVHYDATM